MYQRIGGIQDLTHSIWDHSHFGLRGRGTHSHNRRTIGLAGRSVSITCIIHLQEPVNCLILTVLYANRNHWVTLTTSRLTGSRRFL
ncbi:unnamed protein product [Merluccius merluccius]